MVKFYSVDWLAQSHHSTKSSEEHELNTPACRPHIPCMVQPRPPTLGQSYLEPKPRPANPVTVQQSAGEQDHSLTSSPLHLGHCASPISETSGYSSGYESEATSSECLSVDEGSEADRDAPQRRVRTKFTNEQINKLEKIFSKHKYLDAGERVKTAQKLNLTETQIRTWFQNRRMKLKREVQDYLTPQVPPVMFQPLAPVQYHAMPGQRPHYPATSPAFYPLPVPQLVLQPQMPPHQLPHRVIHSQRFY